MQRTLGEVFLSGSNEIILTILERYLHVEIRVNETELGLTFKSGVHRFEIHLLSRIAHLPISSGQADYSSLSEHRNQIQPPRSLHSVPGEPNLVFYYSSYMCAASRSDFVHPQKSRYSTIHMA